jgi:hypothetical protein
LSPRKLKFTQEEDDLLSFLVHVQGSHDWKTIAAQMRGRTVRQCRERWKYYLDPSLNKGNWTDAEDQLLFAKHQEIGPRWAQIAAFFGSRSDIDLKNRFHRIERVMRHLDSDSTPVKKETFPLLVPDAEVAKNPQRPPEHQQSDSKANG